MENSPLARVNAASRAVTQRIAFIGVVGMLVVGILTTIDVVVLRWLFASPIPGSNEFLTTIFAVSIAAVLASGLAQRANLEIDMLHGALGARTAAWLRAGGSLLFLLLLIFVTWRVWRWLFRSIAGADSALDPPVLRHSIGFRRTRSVRAERLRRALI